MGVLLLIRTTTEGIADHWIQKIRETGVKTQKLRVSEPLEGDDWHVDGEGLKKKLKAIGMVIIGEEIHSEDVSHEKTVINGLNTQQEVTEHAHTEHHDETHTTHSQTAEDTEKVDNEKVSQTPPPHSPGNFEAHHYEQNEHHVHYDDLQVATEDIGSTEEDRHSRPTNQPPRSPLIGENYRANLDPNRFVSPPWQSTNLPRSRSMPRTLVAQILRLRLTVAPFVGV
uniref:Uncharacterized protein n=1 Tax=Plectus sambesii TaxID=2011161 RepID=A0A914W2K2_9BILA